MALKDTFKNLFNYFEIDDSAEVEDRPETYQMTNERPKMRVAPTTATKEPVANQPELSQKAPAQETNLQRLRERQQELRANSIHEDKKTIIDIKFPKKYEEARSIVNLLLDNSSVLIDFQYMSEPQARRCLDYLDGARSVLSGSLKKVSSTMWLLTPVNVTVNIDELRSTSSQEGQHEAQFDFDMKW